MNTFNPRIGGTACTILGLLSCGVTGLVMAAPSPMGTVISSTPITAQVPIPSQQCFDQPVAVQQPNTGGGAVAGALVGGLLGSTVGHGADRAVATGVGAVAGAVVGNSIEAANNPPGSATVRRCQTVMQYEPRTIGYDVVYEYQGQRYTTRLAQNPGAQIALNVTAVGALDAAPPANPAYAPYPPQAAVVQQVPPAVVYGAPYPYYGYEVAPLVVAPVLWFGGSWRWGHGRWH
ncbi:MAG: glycine zipper 2TM domain-containing protein [Burkholderiaceae bacterium]|nr:glycine zipper 2TM domain-containing protein [Roseateles sp.]MBV8471608.1 glycine zipper 2TM domain-containing protein [Burkholderiaceae bacterium]